jgi:DNA-binding NarL/FixJ family response regulator
MVDDHRLMLDGVMALLSDECFFESISGATSVQEALGILKNEKIDVVIADINMPEVSGIELIRIITEQYPDVKVLVLSMHNEKEMITKMIEAGAMGYVIKSADMAELVEAITSVYSGKRFLSKDVRDIILTRFFNFDNISDISHPNETKLTRREAEVLSLIAKEYSNEQIADKLFISTRTVETHRKNIFIKTKQKTIVGLIKYAMDKGWI